jgi:TIR domain-containing protein
MHLPLGKHSDDDELLTVPAQYEIFISHSHQDISTVQALATALSQRGLSVWVDRSDIEEGDAYDTQIEEAIAQTSVVIVLWSEHSTRSHWVRAEAAYALSKHKLLPISIDQCQPPLQFMQIQTLDFCGWQGNCADKAFERLLTDLAKRLDRQFSIGPSVVAAASSPPAAGIETVPKADASDHWIARTLVAGMVGVGLRFPEQVIENEFQDYFCNRMYGIAQFAMLLAFIAYIVYGVSDLASDAAISSTRFRYMIACPLLLLFYFGSFEDFAKRHSQLYISLFAVTLGICLYITVRLLGIETPFRIETGNATMNFMLVLGLLALLPLSVISTVLIGAVIAGLHALIMIETQVPLATSWLNYLHVISMWTIACCIAYWREYQQRRSFAAELT